MKKIQKTKNEATWKLPGPEQSPSSSWLPLRWRKVQRKVRITFTTVNVMRFQIDYSAAASSPSLPPTTLVHTHILSNRCPEQSLASEQLPGTAAAGRQRLGGGNQQVQLQLLPWENGYLLTQCTLGNQGPKQHTKDSMDYKSQNPTWK